MAVDNNGKLSPSCQVIHEEVAVLKAKNKMRDKRDEEFALAIKEFREVLQMIREEVAVSRDKLDNLEEEVNSVRRNLMKLLIGGSIAICSSLIHIILKYIESLGGKGV